MAQDKYDRLRTHIPAIYRPTVNRFIKGLLQAWAEGDNAVADAIAETRAQLFVATASQEFLDRLGSNVGVARPSSLGIGDVDFRDLVPALSYAPKQVRDVLYKLLEVWYAPEAVYTNMVSTAAEPFSLTDGDVLSFVLDREETVTVTFSFRTTDFRDITQATAAEVVNAINKQAVGSGVTALEFNDGITGKRYVRILTDTPGATGEIKIAGGTGQNVLQFPEVRATTQDVGTEWDITLVSGDTVRMEYTGGGLNPSLLNVHTGDLVIVSGPFDDLNIGSFTIVDVVTDATVDGITPGKKYTGNYIEIQNSQATAETVAQTGALDVAFYYPKLHNVHTFARPAVLYEVNHKEVVVILPASATVIGRDETGSAHIHPNTSLQLLNVGDAAGLEFGLGDTLRGMSTIHMSGGGTGDFEEGETVTGGLSGATATVFKVLSNAIADSIIGVINVTGGFIVGETLTGSSSGAQRSFVKTITTTNGTTNIDSILQPDVKFGIQDTQGAFIQDEGILGRTEMRIEYATDNFEADELLTTADVLHIAPPYLGTYTIGETVQGSVSGTTAVIDDIIRDKWKKHTTLQISSIAGPGFQDGELITGLSSLAFGTLETAVLASGATARIDQIECFRPENMIFTLRQETGVFQRRELIIGSSSGAKAVSGIVLSSVATFDEITYAEDFNSPYVFDEAAAFTVSSLSADTAEAIEAGQPKTRIVTSTLPDDFPNEPGYFILDFGASNEEGPIKYTAKPNDTSLIVDPAFIYQEDHPVGSSVRYVRSLEPTVPRATGGDFAAYVTGLAEARTILQELIRSVVAAGVTVRFVVVFPEYAFECYNTNEVI